MSYAVEISLYEQDGLRGPTRSIIVESRDYREFPGAPLGFTWGSSLAGCEDRCTSFVVRNGWLALFEHEDYTGDVLKLGPGSRVDRLGAKGWKDLARSFIAGPENFDPVEAAQQVKLICG
ncbi:MAG TPA: hypothetical protein VD902_10005 [Symbiobacteriaceae bacterium]|nr:hypothetical protein [Symbiobacteriaceae bacterium]